MSKARDLADIVAAGSPLVDGTIETTDITNVTASATELNYTDGVTSNIQTQMDTKAPTASPTFTGTVNLDKLTVNTAAGTAGQVLTSGGTGVAPSWADASAGGVSTFTASGSLTNGDLVSLNSDGTVSVTTGIGLDSTASYGNNGTYSTVLYDSSNDKVVIVYYDAGVGYAVVGSISGTTLTLGTPVQYGAAVENVTATFDSNSNKVVVIYRDTNNSNYGTAKVGTVSGTSISFGSATVFSANITYDTACCFDSSNNKVVVAYRNASTGHGTAIVGTVSGTSISFGSASVFNSVTTLYNECVFDSSNNKVVIGFRDLSGTGYGRAVVATVSGTSISFGTVANFSPDSSGYDYLGMAFDTTANKVLFFWRISSSVQRAIVGTVSGTSISFGTYTSITTKSLNWHVATYSSTANKTFLFVNNTSDSTTDLYLATVSGTSISFDLPILIDDAQARSYLGINSIGDNVVLAYDASSSGLATVYNASNNFTAWVGVATESVSDGAETSITTIGGINEGQTGLSVGSKYYLQGDGTITTTAVANREVGRATSSTDLYVTQGSVQL